MPTQHPDPWAKVRTRHNLAADEVRSTLQKEIRRGNLDNAIRLAFEMFSTSPEMEELLWKRLLVISVEDVGIGEPIAPILVNTLYQAHYGFDVNESERHLFAIHAVRFLCGCRKDRSSDEMLLWMRMLDKRGQLKPEIKEYGVDMHTARGQKMGRDLNYFMREGTKVRPELARRNKTYRRHVMSLLKKANSETS